MTKPSATSAAPRVPQPRTKLGALISRVLTMGLLIAIALLVVGVILAVVRPDLASTHETSIAGIPRAIAALEPTGFFTLGLLVLLLTPVARVVALLVVFTRERRWLFCAFSLIVLAVLTLSAVLGLEIG